MLKDDGVDPQGGRFYSRYERTRVEQRWREQLGKEKREQVRSSVPATFQMNLANANGKGGLLQLKHSHSRLELITEKVQKLSPQERNDDSRFDPHSFEIVATKHQEKIPPQKFDLPCTRSQEYGWLLARPVFASTLHNRGRNSTHLPRCDSDSQLERRKRVTAHGMDSVDLPVLPGARPELRELNINRFYRPKKFGPETKYADIYVSLMHHDPFHQSATR